MENSFKTMHKLEGNYFVRRGRKEISIKLAFQKLMKGLHLALNKLLNFQMHSLFRENIVGFRNYRDSLCQVFHLREQFSLTMTALSYNEQVEST